MLGQRDESAALSRRGFLGVATGAVAGAAVGLTRPGQLLAKRELDSGVLPTTADAIDFYGLHQAGITTPAQRFGCFAAFDVTTELRQQLVHLLRDWTEVAAELCAGHQADRTDDAVSVGLGPARLTVNFGFGPSLFGIGGPDRFGLRRRWPMALAELPTFPGDQLEPNRTGGDLTVHACADDPQVVFHAIRQLARTAGATAVVRWSQTGFNERAVTAGTPRNLLGFKDGTVNPVGEQLEEFVWVGADQDQTWMESGTYVVVRRIRLLLDRWDALSGHAQEQIIGRHKLSGAPLGAGAEHDPLPLGARSADGSKVIGSNAHVRLASAQDNWGQMLLRRSYSFDDGVMTTTASQRPGAPDAGQLFVAYQQNPRIAFVPIYSRLSRHDAMAPFVIHTGSAVAAIPPGAEGPGHVVGETLFSD